MQFRLRTLIIAFSLIAVFCGLFFATPLVIEIPVLAMIVLLAPSFWICGACFGKGRSRPFFLGAICAGWLPHVILMYWGGMAAVATMGGDLSAVPDLGVQDDWGVIARISIAAIFLFPGFCALLGGGCGMLAVYCFSEAEPKKKAPAEPAAASVLREPYVLVESRLTPLTPETVERN
jgi:hypothetical protein